MSDNFKKLLNEYNSLKEEKKDIETSLLRIQKQLKRLEEKGYKVKDVVKGGTGGIQIFQIEGFPYPEYTKVKTKSLLQQQKLSIKIDKIDKVLNQIDNYINSIESSEIRRIITYRHINNMTWQQVSNKMGEYYTADGCRKLLDRYFKAQGSRL